MVNPGAQMRHTAPQEESPLRTVAFLGAGVGLILILYIIAYALKPAAATAPTAYTTIVSPDKSFSVDQPVGWEVSTAGTEGSQYGGVLFRNPTRSVKVDITSSEAGSAVADILNATNHAATPDDGNAPPVPVTPAVETLHDDGEETEADEYGETYTEQPMQKLTTDFGETCVSEFTAGTASKIHGYRVTEVSTNKEVVTICSCPETDWPVMKPVFMRIIQSIKPGPG